ncbi:hypothetical protein JXB11_00010 [Candidatus Woesearchaeota archaeon]|nr:hypothetical protein [Candidatus Woesearchaeota archaeon]
MKKKMILGLVFSLVVLLAASAVQADDEYVCGDYASDLPIIIEEVEIDGTEVVYDEDNSLSLERGQDIDVKVKMSATEDVDNVELMAYISGYEHSDVEPISDTTAVFDMDANVTYIKKLQLSLPSRADEDTYKLRLVIADRSGDECTPNYLIKVDVPRHDVQIRDVVFSPDGSVQAGRALLATVRVKNTGEKDEDSIKVKVEIPSLDVSATDFIDELESDDTTTSEELFMRIPDCAKPGTYEVKVTVEFNEGEDAIRKTEVIEVTEGDVCPIKAEVEGRITVTVGGEAQTIEAGGAGAAYPVAITNSGTGSRTFSLGVEGVSNWGTARMSPSNVMNVAGGETKTAFVFVTANSGAADGERLFVLSIKDASGDTLQDITLKADVMGGSAGSIVSLSNARRVLEIGLIALVVILVIVGLIIAFRRMRGPEGEESQTYY